MHVIELAGYSSWVVIFLVFTPHNMDSIIAHMPFLGCRAGEKKSKDIGGRAKALPYGFVVVQKVLLAFS